MEGGLTFRAALRGILGLVLDQVTVGVGTIMTSVEFSFEIEASVLVLERRPLEWQDPVSGYTGYSHIELTWHFELFFCGFIVEEL